MADNFLEKHQEEYEQKKASWEKKKRLDHLKKLKDDKNSKSSKNP